MKIKYTLLMIVLGLLIMGCTSIAQDISGNAVCNIKTECTSNTLNYTNTNTDNQNTKQHLIIDQKTINIG